MSILSGVSGCIIEAVASGGYTIDFLEIGVISAPVAIARALCNRLYAPLGMLHKKRRRIFHPQAVDILVDRAAGMLADENLYCRPTQPGDGGYLAPIGVDLVCIPAFANILIDGEERTAIKLICEER